MRRHTTPTTALKSTLAGAALLALTASLTACGSDDADSSGRDDEPATAAAAAAGSEESDAAESDAPESDAPGAGSFEPGSEEQVDAVRTCFADLGLSTIDAPAPQRPEHRLNIEPVKDGPDQGFEGLVYFFESDARALEERPNVTFWDEDTEFDSTVGNVLVAYFPAPSKDGGLEQGIEDCLA